MKNFYKLIFLVLPFLTVSCINDPEIMENEEDTVNLEISLFAAISSRSYTENNGSSSDGELEGTDLENKLETVNVFLYDENDNLVKTLPFEMMEDGSFLYRITVDELKRYLGTDYNVYIIANFGALDITDPKTATFSVTDLKTPPLGVYNSHTIPMTNYEAVPINISMTAEDVEAAIKRNPEWRLPINSYIKGWDARIDKSIPLERCIARIDYKDGSTYRNPEGEAEPNKFPLIDRETKETLFVMEIVSMQMINVSKTAYVFRHTSTGDMTKIDYEDVKLFGIENGGVQDKYNWIVSSDFANKLTYADNIEKRPAGYFMNQDDYSSSNYEILLEDLEEVTADNKGYHPWCYVMENTLPSTASMIRGLSTAIAFHVKVWNKDGEEIKATDGNKTLEMQVNDITKVIEPSEDGYYYLDYYVYVRHNDPDSSNGDPHNAIRPMEFGVARNNVYQFCVTGIVGFPEPNDPDIPDEVTTIKITCRVLPWTYNEFTVTW